jgi:hypothetical protein
MKLAECLLRRKELQEKVDQLARIKVDKLFELQVKRVKVTDAIDEVVANVPKLTAAQVTEEYNFYAKALRNIDGLIQQTNWTTVIEDSAQWFRDYEAKSE